MEIVGDENGMQLPLLLIKVVVVVMRMRVMNI